MLAMALLFAIAGFGVIAKHDFFLVPGLGEDFAFYRNPWKVGRTHRHGCQHGHVDGYRGAQLHTNPDGDCNRCTDEHRLFNEDTDEW